METAKVLMHRKTHGGASTVATIVDNSGVVPHLKSHSNFVSSTNHSHKPISSSGETDSTVVLSRMLEDACCRNVAEEKVLCLQCSRYHHVHNTDSLLASLQQRAEMHHASVAHGDNPDPNMMRDILINSHIHMNNIIHMDMVLEHCTIDEGGLFGGNFGWINSLMNHKICARCIVLWQLGNSFLQNGGTTYGTVG